MNVTSLGRLGVGTFLDQFEAQRLEDARLDHVSDLDLGEVAHLLASDVLHHLPIGGFQGQRAALWIDAFHPRGHGNHLRQFRTTRLREQHRPTTGLGLLGRPGLGQRRHGEAPDHQHQ
jgi:hypothetical protein